MHFKWNLEWAKLGACAPEHHLKSNKIINVDAVRLGKQFVPSGKPAASWQVASLAVLKLVHKLILQL